MKEEKENGRPQKDQEKGKTSISEEEVPEKQEEKVEKDEGAELKERFLRLAAEFDNYKKRTKKEIEEASLLGKIGLVKDLLSVIDELQMAVAAAAKSPDKDLAKGIEMIYLNLMGRLQKSGLSEIKTEGKFDPFKHEILMVVEGTGEEGAIVEVVKKGYEFGGRMIRPASVVVSKLKTKTKTEPEPKKETGQEAKDDNNI